MIRLYLIIGALAAALISGGLMYRSCKRSWEAEFKAKAHEEVQKQTEEVQEDAKKRAEKVKQMAPGDYLRYWDSEHGVQPPDAGGGPTPAPGKAPPGKP